MQNLFKLRQTTNTLSFHWLNKIYIPGLFVNFLTGTFLHNWLYSQKIALKKSSLQKIVFAKI